MSDTNSPPNTVRLRKRSPEAELAYWQGFKAGLETAKHGIQRSLDHFDDMLISRCQNEEGGNN